MKKILILAAVILAGHSTFAQDMGAALERAIQKTEKMASSLELTPDQVERVKILNEGIEQKNEYINSDATMSMEEKQSHIQKNEEARNKAFQQVLTEDQYSKYKLTQIKTVSPKSRSTAPAPATRTKHVENK